MSRFQILALDGGGFRGMFSASVLSAFEEDLGRPILDHFDLVVGTSTGGVIALALGAGLAPREIVEFYSTHGGAIFPSQRRRRLRHLVRAKYNPASLRRCLDGVFGDRTLADSRVRLVVPAYDIGSDAVYLFKTPHNQRLRRDWRERMSDVAMATTAAPTYFPAFTLDHVRLVDGGVWANNPALVGVAEAVSMCDVPLDAIRVFSLGTTSDLRHRGVSLDRGGLLQWARNATDVILRGQSIGAHNAVRHLLGEDRVLRLDPPVPAGILRLDKVDTAALVGRARSVSRNALPLFEEIFGGHRAQPYAPLYPERKTDAGHR